MEKSKSPRQRKRQKTRPPARLSIEMILRKSFMDSLTEYVNCCSLVGVKQMCDPSLSWLLRTIWVLVFCAAVATTCYFLQYVWTDTLNKPLIVTTDSTTYPIGSIDFPAVALCNINRISKKALKRFARDEYFDLTGKSKVDKKSLAEVEKILLNWGKLINFSFNASLLKNPMYRNLVKKYRKDAALTSRIMEMLAPDCKDMLLACSWGGQYVDCNAIFKPHRIANRGHCCTFNYRMTKNGQVVKTQNEPGHVYGLNVLLDTMVDDYAYPLYAVQGFDVLILDPAHYADPNAGRVIHRISEPNMATYLELKSTKQIATHEVRKYFLKTRKCLFQDEDIGSQRIFDVYSYSTCIVLCRIQTIYTLCKCTPYFFALKDFQKGPVCTFEQLNCLNKYREKLYYLYPINSEHLKGLELELQDSLYCPECLPDCELTHYSTKSFEIPLTSPNEGKDYKNTMLRRLNDTKNKSFLSIYHPLPDANLDRLDVVFYWYEILSNIGGFSGVIIGFSIVSGIEILYFLTIRFCTHFLINYSKHH